MTLDAVLAQHRVGWDVPLLSHEHAGSDGEIVAPRWSLGPIAQSWLVRRPARRRSAVRDIVVERDREGGRMRQDSTVTW